MAAAANAAEYVKLEQRLTLLAWLNDQFGFQTNAELLADVKRADEGFQAEGPSYIVSRLLGLGERLKVSRPDLERYDSNVKKHLAAINRGRHEPITLRYFQHLALLYTELFLDWRFNRVADLLQALNEHVRAANSRKTPGDALDSEFAEEDLNKLAFWMATGSGKTLIMHFNYRQYMHYKKEPLDNILLITPSEGMTEQHMTEMAASGIDCERFSLEESGLGLAGHNTVRVIEITKLVEEKRGGGVSVPVEAFEGNNLIFVDEGHKGAGSEARRWVGYREKLAETGFTFEYSATFGQAMTAARNDQMTAEYGKAIIFDYSYRYFYGDGYGKDFHILNLKEETDEEKTELLLTGNLLSFYEQQRCFREQAESLRPYNLDRPLWVFVGSRVNTTEQARQSDVLTVARFLHHFLENKRGWAVRAIEKIIHGKTGLVDADGEDVFAERFDYLRESPRRPEVVFRDVLDSVFHSTAGTLHMCDIRGKAGELGLKVGGAEDYFGLIYIGDTAAFKKLVEEDDADIQVEEDAVSGSLFEGINSPDTRVNVLIGAKKFMEGWNSWRVSNMGLLNIGRSEGSEIIQLFGRGVRLKGFGMSLKRTSALDGTHPEHIRLLETLNIFAVRANYMAQFRDYLEREGVQTEGQVEIPLAIRPNKDFLDKNLVVPRLPEGRSFAEECNVMLEPDEAARVSLDLSVKVDSMRSAAGQLRTASMKDGHTQPIPAERLDLVDWDAVYVSLLEFKEEMRFTNLVIPPDMPRKIMQTAEPALCELIADKTVVNPESFARAAVFQDAVLSLLRKYVEKYYRLSEERWATEAMDYRKLTKDDTNFQDYLVRVPRREAKLVAAIQQLIQEADRVYGADKTELPTLHFGRHLYQPLLIRDSHGLITSQPEGLEPSAKRFVEDIRAYWRDHWKEKHAGQELFLLRNLSKGKGVGFYLTAGFFPDFILWLKTGDSQRIVFVEPHGMLHEEAYWTDDKVHLHERLAGLSAKWGQKPRGKKVTLDSFIISATPYERLYKYYADRRRSKSDFAAAHILFFDENQEYVARLFQ